MSEFEQATVVASRGDGTYDAAIVEGWDIAGNANGGYLIALAARAMTDAVERPPLSITAHYLSPGKVGPVTIDVDVVRAGRRMAVVRSTVASPEHGPVMALLGTFADQPAPEDAGPSVIAAAPPELPPIEQCVPAGPPVGMNDSGFGQRVVCSYHPDDTGFRSGNPTGTAVMRGWFEFADGTDVDAFGLLVALDAFAPVCFNREEFPPSWAPTLELTAHVRESPAPGPLRCVFRSRFIQNGMFEEDGEIWDSRGVLVAQSRQLALIPKPA
ncbi:MAG: diacylglycerol kinase [Acidimicrobiaceae bacterium]|nr:diacylglycerol kinase [Acidimicrobiaceae bacterium]